MTLTVDQDCFECWPGATAGPDDEHIVVVTADDYYELFMCGELEINGELYWAGDGCQFPDHAPPCEVWLAVSCQDMQLHMANDCVSPDGAAHSLDAVASNGPVEYGDWVIRAWQEDDGSLVGPVREVAFRFAEVCEAEFVPEPGTIALLGSGLAGLAGYAILRWRARS
jgi:hypothetical protein